MCLLPELHDFKVIGLWAIVWYGSHVYYITL